MAVAMRLHRQHPQQTVSCRKSSAATVDGDGHFSIASLSRMQQHNGDIQQQQPHSLSLLKIPAPSLSTFSSKSTPLATTSSNIGGGGGDYSIANCNNSPQQQTLFTTERLSQMGVIN
jgi:hypothetical protein